MDRISELPEEIITAILSCLPPKEAATTSLLSSQWLDLWKHSPILKFDTNTNAKLVDSVLESHKALSLTLFSISCHIDKSAQSQVAKWLDFVFSRRVEALRLDFECQRIVDRVAFDELLRESRVSLLFFKSLKRLCLQCLKMRGEDVELFVRNCPSLTHLTIQSVNFTSNVEIRGMDDHPLRYLNLLYSQGGISVKIHAPNLARVLVDQCLGKLMFENVPKLERLRFRIKNPLYVVQQFACVASCFISKLHTLSLSLFHPKVFLESGTYPQMPNLKVLLVRDHGVYEHGGLLPLTDLVWAAPHLRKFKLQFFGDLRNATPANINVERPMHKHLKKFKFRGKSAGESDHIVELAAYLSEKCAVLENVIIGRPLLYRAEEESDGGYIKLQLQGKLPKHIQVQLSANVQ